MKLSLTATPSASRFAPILLRGRIADAFELAARLGYDGVELHLRRPEEVDAGEVRELCLRHRLSVPTLGTGMAAGQDGLTFASPDPAVRDQATAIIRRHVDLAATIASGVTIGLIFGRVGTAPAERQRAMEHAVACLGDCAAYADGKGVTLLLEPLNRYESDALNTLSAAAAVIGQVGRDNIRLLADTFHMNIEERDMVQALAENVELLGHVHLVDSNRQAPGMGHVQFGPILETLRRGSYQGFLSFEVLPGAAPPETAQQAVAHVRSLLAGSG